MNKEKLPPIVQMFDRIRVREYTKMFQGFLFSSEEVVRTDMIKSTLVLKIDAERMPDKIFFNGEEVTLSTKEL